MLLLAFECCCEQGITTGVKICADCDRFCREMKEAFYGAETAMNFQKISLSKESSQIDEVGYHEQSQTLQITFKRGGVYEYDNVPMNVVQTMVHAPSIGSYFGQNVKNKYPTFKIVSGKRVPV